MVNEPASKASEEGREKDQGTTRVDIMPIPDPDKDGYIGYRGNDPHVNRIKELKEKYDFPSRAAFLRCMVQLGMNSVVQNDPRNKARTQSSGEQPVAIRDLVPESEENSVDVRDELPEIIEENLLDIVDEDPQINRDGWRVWK
jgi:hypothetical protein